MNNAPTLFIGDPWRDLILPLLLSIIILIVGLIMFVIWVRFSQLPTYFLALAYFILVIILGLPVLFTDHRLTWSSVPILISFFLTLPWSGLASDWLGTKGPGLMEFVCVVIGGVLNAAIIFGISVLARKIIKRFETRNDE